jgi:hypothetical protein
MGRSGEGKRKHRRTGEAKGQRGKALPKGTGPAVRDKKRVRKKKGKKNPRSEHIRENQ